MFRGSVKGTGYPLFTRHFPSGASPRDIQLDSAMRYVDPKGGKSDSSTSSVIKYKIYRNSTRQLCMRISRKLVSC